MCFQEINQALSLMRKNRQRVPKLKYRIYTGRIKRKMLRMNCFKDNLEESKALIVQNWEIEVLDNL